MQTNLWGLKGQIQHRYNITKQTCLQDVLNNVQHGSIIPVMGTSKRYGHDRVPGIQEIDKKRMPDTDGLKTTGHKAKQEQM